MMDCDKLVKALRHCVSDEKGVTKCAGCPYYPDITGCMDRLHTDAAAAIEALQARLGEAENSVERWKDMYLTKHEPKRGEIVRCGECKYWMDIDDGRQKHEMCAQLMPNWFCADGELKLGTGGQKHE